MTALRYIRYLARHKWFVFVEACRLGVPFLGIAHDLSKLRWSEFWPYTAYFYGGKRKARSEYSVYEKTYHWGVIERECKEAVQERFDHAWLQHQHANKHHYQHWILREDDGGTKLLPMPDRYRREMLADWRGAGKAIMGAKSDTRAWYLKNCTNIQLHPETRAWIERELNAPVDLAASLDREKFLGVPV